MSLSRTTIWLLSVAACLAASSIARAQHYQPFIDPHYFDYDMQMFASAADIDTYGGEPVMREGWFGSYSRMYIAVTRPDVDAAFDVNNSMVGPVLAGSSHTQSDFTWGNRWDFGYMTEENHGWGFNYTHIDGPNENAIVRFERINRLNEDDEGRPDPADMGAGDDIVEPIQDRNQSGPPNRARFYDLTDSLNDADYNSIELNKIFRMAPLHHGGVIEPFFGVRYSQFTDTFRRDNYIRYDDMGQIVPILPGGPATGAGTGMPPPPAFDDATIEDYMMDLYRFKNDMFGGQIGIRWLKKTSRWNLSSEFRAVAFQNFQTLTRTLYQERTYYDGFGTGTETTSMEFSKNKTYEHATETVAGCDIRAEAAYELTRDVHLQFGMQFIGFFTGIGRGPLISQNSEDVIMVGGTFGFVWNR